ncbi:MAG: amino acid carrier protein, partial [Planctomycetota bacterium]
MLESINNFVNAANGVLFSQFVITTLLITGVVFTILTFFGQWRAITHGSKVVAGKYDEKDDPGAISHFQALSTALSATVGLGNIAGVSIAIALGGPGAVLWMWVIGVLGMALKMTEVTQSMLYRNTEDPKNPHGGPMFVAQYGLNRIGVPFFGSFIGGLFVITLLISAATGGNMYQVWNAADTTLTYFGFPTLYTGLIIAGVTALVIIGGIRIIGRVTSIIVPFMCVIYVLAAFWVLGNNITEVPRMLWQIVTAGLGIDTGAGISGAFIGGTLGSAVNLGVQRALFSSEAGQGSAPIAHSAVKTDEPVREGIVAGLEPLIDTLVVCTITALVLLSTGAYNREAEATFASTDALQIEQVETEEGEPAKYTIANTPQAQLPERTEFYRDIRRADPFGLDESAAERPDFEAERDKVFVFVDTYDEDGNATKTQVVGDVAKNDDGSLFIEWAEIESALPPTLEVGEDGEPTLAMYGHYVGSTLTAHAFDRTTPGLGKYLLTVAVWLFALSTIIAWSYYGEQGIVFLTGGLSEGAQKTAVLVYKLLYCGLLVLTTLEIDGWLETDEQLNTWTTLGLGVMLVVNVPLMWLFGLEAMKAYHQYVARYTDDTPMHDEI